MQLNERNGIGQNIDNLKFMEFKRICYWLHPEGGVDISPEVKICWRFWFTYGKTLMGKVKTLKE